MSKLEGSSSLFDDKACERFRPRVDIVSPHCYLCGWEKVDHRPLTQLEVLTQWAYGGNGLREGQAQCHVQELIEMLDKVREKTGQWHRAYTEAMNAEGMSGVVGTINDLDDAGHAIEEILNELLDAPVPGTGGIWAIVINGGQMSRHPTRFSALFSAEAARRRGDRVEVYAEIYPDGKSHWELQAL